MKSIMLAQHGVGNVSHVPGLRKESWRKAHETKKQNGTHKASKIERAFCDALESEGVRFLAQPIVLGRPIDVFLMDEDIYVQIDGRYWHGLDRPIEEIRASSYPRDRTIAERWEADRRQDEQFAERGLRLVRVTDLEAREWLRSKQKLLPLLRQRAVRLMRLTISQLH
jgi:G:T-mismatch repair DNA endonuclease (very short patch repair protein)